MTPHSALESMLAIEETFEKKDLFELFWEDGWITARDALRLAVHFEFGEAVPDTAHLEFAMGMQERGLFKLPYPSVLYTGNCSKKTGVLGFHHPGDRKEDKTIFMIVMTAFMVDTPLTMAFPAVPVSISSSIPGEERIHWRSLTKGGLQRTRDGTTPLDEKGMENRSARAWSLLSGWTTLMMSKDVETIKLDAPYRLNKARALKGKLPIKERMIVRIKPEARERQRQAALGFERNSPKMHWRRGHFRTLHEKHGGVTIPIAPMIINAADDVKPIAKSYKIG